MAGNSNSGGKRRGASRKKKSLAERALEGQEGLSSLQFPEIDVPDDIPEPREYLSANQRQGDLNATEIRKET